MSHANLLTKFKKELGNENNENKSPDEELLRFLNEWDGSVQVAVKKYLLYLSWRKAQIPLSTNDLTTVLTSGCLFQHGSDRANRPVIYFREVKRNPEILNAEVMVKCMTTEADRIFQSADEICVVFDRSGCEFRRLELEFIRLFYYTFKTFYPMRIACLVLYPFTVLTKTFWLFVKHIFDTKTQRRIHFAGNTQELSLYISKEQLPDFLN